MLHNVLDLVPGVSRPCPPEDQGGVPIWAASRSCGYCGWPSQARPGDPVYSGTRRMSLGMEAAPPKLEVAAIRCLRSLSGGRRPRMRLRPPAESGTGNLTTNWVSSTPLCRSGTSVTPVGAVRFEGMQSVPDGRCSDGDRSCILCSHPSAAEQSECGHLGRLSAVRVLFYSGNTNTTELLELAPCR